MILDSASGLLPGLLPASFRGVGFFVPDIRSDVGRRVAMHLFPGVDRAAFDDMGMLPDRVTVDGILVGDDYVAQATRLRAAFVRPGSGTLMHPWLGGMTVIMDETAEILFSARELRVARFNAVFKRTGGLMRGSGLATAPRLLSAALGLASSSLAMLRSPGRLTLSQARGAAAVRSSRIVASAWAGLAPRLTEAAIPLSGRGAAASSAVRLAGPAASALADVLAMPTPGTPEALAVQVERLSAVLLAAVPTGPPAVAPAAEAPPPSEPLDPREAFEAARSVAAVILAAEPDAPSAADRAMLVAASGSALGCAGATLGRAVFSSRDDAAAVRASMTDALGAVAEAMDGLTATVFAAPASLARRAIVELRTAAIADINEAIGRLPAVVVVETVRETDAFAVANHLYGDDPALIEAGYLSIVSRNRPRHPAQLAPGRVEALK